MRSWIFFSSNNFHHSGCSTIVAAAAASIHVSLCVCTQPKLNPFTYKTMSKKKQINSVLKTGDKSVSAELTILANVTDNQAIYKCEAHNSATEIPLFETKTLSVHCK